MDDLMVRMAEALRTMDEAYCDVGPRTDRHKGRQALMRSRTALAEYDTHRAARLGGPAVAGFVMVPVEPTEAMLRDGAARYRDFLTENGTYPRTQAVWKAMLSAAPDAMSHTTGQEKG